MICLKCGKEIDNDSKFCEGCGNVVEAASTPQPGNNVYEVTQPKSIIHNGDMPPNPIMQNKVVAPKPNSPNKKLKVAFFSILGASCLLVVLIFVFMIAWGDSPIDIGSILEGNPKIPDEVITDWGKGEYSLNSIGKEGATQEAVATSADGGSASQEDVFTPFMGVWKIEGLKTNFDDGEYETVFPDGDGGSYIVVDVGEIFPTIHYISLGQDNTVLSQEKYLCTYVDGVLISRAPLGSPEGATVEYQLKDSAVYGTIMLDDMQQSEWAVYVKSKKSIEEILGSDAATQGQSSDNQVAKLESDLLGAWEVSYEHDYIGMEYYIDGTVHYVHYFEIDGDDKYDKSIKYEVISQNEIILSNDPNNKVVIEIEYDAQSNPTKLKFADMELYKVDSLSPPQSMPGGQTRIEDYIGDYYGYYENNSGEMYMAIIIYDFEYTDEYEQTDGSEFYYIDAEFHFAPSDEDSTGKQGSYSMTGLMEIAVGAEAYVWLEGVEWLSDKPSANYNMLDLEGLIDLSDGSFEGELDRDNKPEFYLIKE